MNLEEPFEFDRGVGVFTPFRLVGDPAPASHVKLDTSV